MVVDGGVVVLEDVGTRSLEVPDGGFEAETVQGLEEVGGGGLLPQLRQIEGGNGHC